ncbi:GGDEF domain-containing protein [Candidatus Saccharibacteria bacterium]|nr:GGDEF domain-containing protein [Candidatus Saccharibacteria bacterium]
MTEVSKFAFPNANYSRQPGETFSWQIADPADRTGFEVADALERHFQSDLQKESECEAAKKACLVDPLTGCLNKRYLEKFIEDGFDPINDSGRLGVVYIDINDFKLINDRDGHAAGDKTLQDFATFIHRSMRKHDTLIRLGGDEFVLLCPYESARNDGPVVDFEANLMLGIESNLVKRSDLSFSYGVAVFDRKIDNGLSNTVHRADGRMYEYKANASADS